MEEKLLLLSIRFWHPTFGPEVIQQEFELTPVVVRKIGEMQVLRNGMSNGRKNDETYVVYEYLKTDDIDLSLAVSKANAVLCEKKHFLDDFRRTGGRYDYYISIVSEKLYSFELSPALICECSELNLKIGVEVYADLERSE